MAREESHFGLRLGDASSAIKLPNDMEGCGAAVCFFFWRERERNPEICRDRELDVFVHHANDCVRSTVDGHRLSEHSAVGSEATLPQPVAQDDHLIVAKLVFARRKGAALGRMYAERKKEIGGDSGAVNALRFACARQVHVKGTVGREVLEQLAL